MTSATSVGIADVLKGEQGLPMESAKKSANGIPDNASIYRGVYARATCTESGELKLKG